MTERLPLKQLSSPSSDRPRRRMPRWIPSLVLLTGFALSACGGPAAMTGTDDARAVQEDERPAEREEAQGGVEEEATAGQGPEKPDTAAADGAEQPRGDAQVGSALAMLYALEVKGRAPKTGYDRDQFGWRDDVDRNGCDTRNDVLRRDLTGITLKSGGCVVLGGVLSSDYTGDTFDFIRGNGNNIDIDHVVSLSNAWQTGAQRMSDSQKVRFANDPINLIAVESSVNRQKGDGDAATWLPPRKGYRCEYVARQIAVKHTYDLWVVQPEFDAMERLLLNCDQDAFGEDPWPGLGDGDRAPEPKTETAPAPAPKAEPAPAPRSSGSGETSGGSGPGSRPDGAYKNCTEARERGGAPVMRGSSGYGKHLDRDGDGVGCE